MSILNWFTRNWADTDEGIDPALAPPLIPMPISTALELVEQILSAFSLWTIESVDREQFTLHATRRTRIMCFVDDIRIRLEEVPEGTRLHARSQSRVGKGDLGQNRRNLLELFRTLKKTSEESS